MDRRLASFALLLAALAPTAAVAAENGEKKKKTGGTSYIAIDTITATVIRPDGRRGVLTVETGIDLPDPALQAKARLVLPRLRAAYVQTVQIYGAGLPPGGLPNVDYLSRELQRQTDLTLGGAGGRLLLGTVMVN